MMLEWKDTTSYSRDDKDKIPSVWTLYVPGLRISVVRTHRYCPDSWCMHCAPWFDTYSLNLDPTVENRDAATAKAMKLVRQKLAEAVRGLEQ